MADDRYLLPALKNRDPDAFSTLFTQRSFIFLSKH